MDFFLRLSSAGYEFGRALPWGFLPPSGVWVLCSVGLSLHILSHVLLVFLRLFHFSHPSSFREVE